MNQVLIFLSSFPHSFPCSYWVRKIRVMDTHFLPLFSLLISCFCQVRKASQEASVTSPYPLPLSPVAYLPNRPSLRVLRKEGGRQSVHNPFQYTFPFSYSYLYTNSLLPFLRVIREDGKGSSFTPFSSSLSLSSHLHSLSRSLSLTSTPSFFSAWLPYRPSLRVSRRKAVHLYLSLDRFPYLLPYLDIFPSCIKERKGKGAHSHLPFSSSPLCLTL